MKNLAQIGRFLWILPCILAAASAPLLGERQKTARTEVCGAPSAGLSASPNAVAAGQTVTLSWTSANANAFSISGVGSVSGTSVQVVPGCCGDVSYTLTASNVCGQSAEASATVNVRHRNKVFLSGSRYWTPPSVGDYMWQYTTDPNYGAAEGASVRGFVNTHASGEAKDRFNEFADLFRSWPPSAQAYQQAHTAGRTYIVDEEGKVIGDLDTFSIFDTGLPGLSYLGNPWGNGDYNKVFVGNGSLTFNGLDYDVVGFVSVSPIILDLDDNGIPDVDREEWLPHPTRFNRQRALIFDINGDGFPELTEWLGPNDGLLAFLRSGGERPMKEVRGGGQLLGNPIGFVDGYQKLGMRFDADKNGRVEGAELKDLWVWKDLNRNGKSELEELRTAQSLGITSIETNHQNLKGSFTIGGQRRPTWDWWPTCMLIYPSLARAR